MRKTTAPVLMMGHLAGGREVLVHRNAVDSVHEIAELGPDGIIVGNEGAEQHEQHDDGNTCDGNERIDGQLRAHVQEQHERTPNEKLCDARKRVYATVGQGDVGPVHHHLDDGAPGLHEEEQAGKQENRKDDEARNSSRKGKDHKPDANEPAGEAIAGRNGNEALEQLGHERVRCRAYEQGSGKEREGDATPSRTSKRYTVTASANPT